MKKLIGSIIIMLILTQPATTDYSDRIKTLSIHIFQEYKDYAKLDIIKKEESLLEVENIDDDDDDDNDLDTIENLSDNMNLVTNLLKLKNETISTIQNSMNQKVKNRETMTEEQILKFQEFTANTQQKNIELQTALQQIESKKSLKAMQEAILQPNTDYNKLKQEIESIKTCQDIAIASLTSIINSGYSVLDIL